MPRYTVNVRFECERELTVYGRDEEHAKERAAEIVSGWNDWNNVISADVQDAEEEE